MQCTTPHRSLTHFWCLQTSCCTRWSQLQLPPPLEQVIKGKDLTTGLWAAVDAIIMCGQWASGSDHWCQCSCCIQVISVKAISSNSTHHTRSFLFLKRSVTRSSSCRQNTPRPIVYDTFALNWETRGRGQRRRNECVPRRSKCRIQNCLVLKQILTLTFDWHGVTNDRQKLRSFVLRALTKLKLGVLFSP